MIRKKKGSTLVTTIIIFGALLTVGVALLSMSLADYKMMQSQNKRIRNLYGSDSGLDVTYDILVRDFDSAAQFGAFRAKQLEVKDVNVNKDSPYKKLYKDEQDKLDALNKNEAPYDTMTPTDIVKTRKEITDKMDELINKEFRRSFKTFLYMPKSTDADEDSKSNIEYSKPDQLKISLEGKQGDGIKRNYIVGLKDGIKVTDKDIDNANDFEWSSVELVSNGVESEPQINVEIPKYPDISNDDVEQKYEIRVNSTFITIGGNAVANGQNKRTVQAIYTLSVPNYKDVVFGESEIKEHSIYKDKGLTIGGNMSVGDTTGDVTIDGNIFVEGTSEETLFDNKYTNGIVLNNVKKVDFNGNVVTRKTFNFGTNVKDANISGNLYADNVYAGGTDGIDSDKYKLTVKDMVLNNDLTLNTINTNITVNNFYGINDKTIGSSTNNKSYKSEGYNKATNSSSIIVNKYKAADGTYPSNITIKNEALIMGVAYINTGNGYATGESVAVKGNYNAYSEHVDSDDNKNTDTDNNKNLGFDANHDVDSPLYLVDGTVVQKDDHFFDYWSGKSGVDTGGVHFENLDKIYSTGAIVYENDGSKIEKAKGPMETLQSEMIPKKNEYALRAYNMDMGEITSDLSSDSSLTDLYANPSKGKTVGKLMNFPQSEPTDKFIDRKAIQIGDENDKFALFNPLEIREIVIEATSSNEISISPLDGTKITISVPTNKTLNAFIATAGSVTINGEVKIKGNIIAKGNLDIKGSGNKTITYDPNLATRLQMTDAGAEIFEIVFGEGDTKSPSGDTEIVVQYDLPKFLKNLLWKLVK